MKHLNVIFRLSFLFFVAPASIAASASSQAFLKINNRYILYTNPIVPYLDEHGNFIVALQPMAAMMNAAVATLPQAHTRSFTWRGHTLIFTAGSRQVLIDNVAQNMPVAPCIQPQSVQVTNLSLLAKALPEDVFLVPLSVFLHVYHLGAVWDAHTHVLSIAQKNMLENVEALHPDGSGDYDPPWLPQTELLPAAISVTHHPHWKDTLKLTLKNVSTRTIPTGCTLIHLLIRGSVYSDVLYTRINFPEQWYSYPAVPPNGTLTTLEDFNYQPPSPTIYVIGIIHTAK